MTDVFIQFILVDLNSANLHAKATYTIYGNTVSFDLF